MPKKEMTSHEEMKTLLRRMKEKRIERKEIAQAINIKIATFNTCVYKLSMPVDQFLNAIEFVDNFSI